MNTVVRSLAVMSLALGMGACASTSSSESTGAAALAYTGKVLIVEASVPANVKHTVLGTVKADARAGYSSGSNLYPLLADEARKLGANAVVGVTGGRKVTMLSWAAAYVSGTAIRVDDTAGLKSLQGESH